MSEVDTEIDTWGWMKRQQARMSTPEYIAGENVAQVFTINGRQEKLLNAWYNEHIKICKFRPTEENPFPAGAIGGLLTYSFTSTNLGQVCHVDCACGEETDITEYEDW